MKEILNKLPNSAKKLFNSVSSTYGDKVAWKVILNRLVPSENVYLARSEDFESFTKTSYTFVADKAKVNRSEDGYSYVDYTLATGNVAKDGYKFGAMALKSMADKINLEGLVGRADGDHNFLNELEMKGMSEEDIEEELKKVNSGIKAVSAVYDPKGKVTATLKVRNDVLQDVLKYDAASVEVVFPKDAIRGDLIPQAQIRGFVLTNNPVDPFARKV